MAGGHTVPAGHFHGRDRHGEARAQQIEQKPVWLPLHRALLRGVRHIRPLSHPLHRLPQLPEVGRPGPLGGNRAEKLSAAGDGQGVLPLAVEHLSNLADELPAPDGRRSYPVRPLYLQQNQGYEVFPCGLLPAKPHHRRLGGPALQPAIQRRQVGGQLHPYRPGRARGPFQLLQQRALHLGPGVLHPVVDVVWVYHGHHHGGHHHHRLRRLRRRTGGRSHQAADLYQNHPAPHQAHPHLYDHHLHHRRDAALRRAGHPHQRPGRPPEVHPHHVHVPLQPGLQEPQLRLRLGHFGGAVPPHRRPQCAGTEGHAEEGGHVR